MSIDVARPDARFLIAHPAHFVALGFGSGLAPVAPGTWGTLIAIPIATLLWRTGSDAAFLLAVAILIAVGTWAAQVTSRNLGAHDHGSIVIDEIAAFLLMLFFVGPAPMGVAFAFLTFRIFDITKPPPIRAVDERWSGGIGVMADDLIAACYALIVFAVGVRLLEALP
jgi:phosphatidylglycerophosphatase A